MFAVSEYRSNFCVYVVLYYIDIEIEVKYDAIYCTSSGNKQVRFADRNMSPQVTSG